MLITKDDFIDCYIRHLLLGQTKIFQGTIVVEFDGLTFFVIDNLLVLCGVSPNFDDEQIPDVFDEFA